MFYGRMGQNMQFYCESFGTNIHDAVTLAKERKVDDDKEMVWRTCMINELVMVHDGVCRLSSDEFVNDDVCALISYLTVELSDFFSLFLSVYFLFVLSCVYLKYDLL